MNIAVCLSGAIKFPEKSLDSISRIYPNKNIKIFIHTWKIGDINLYKFDSNSKQNQIVNFNILKKYNPEDILVEKYFQKENLFKSIYKKLEVNENLMYENFYRSRSDIGVISMFYSMFKSNELKCKYEEKNNVLFDKVIRMRFDSNFLGNNLFVDFSDKLQIPIGRDWGGLNDQFFIAPSKKMNYCVGVFDEFINYNFKDKLYNPEFIFKEHIEKKFSGEEIERINFEVQIN